MASRFDPSRFIAAEKSQVSQTVAAPATVSARPATVLKSAGNCGFSLAPEPTVATVATIAGAAGETLPWSDALALFVDRPAPAGMTSTAWQALLQEVWDVSRIWGAQALSLGWTPLDLFGCNPDPFARRVDRNGLAVTVASLLTRADVTDIVSDAAVITDRGGSIMRYRPPVGSGAKLVWHAYPLASGP